LLQLLPSGFFLRRFVPRFPKIAFRREVVLCGRFIADIYAPSLRLVIEVDGGYHARTEPADARRDRALLRAGYRVVRIDAVLIVRDVAAAIERNVSRCPVEICG
jgi:very-short-patch-repair endonuclease